MGGVLEGGGERAAVELDQHRQRHLLQAVLVPQAVYYPCQGNGAPGEQLATGIG